MQFSPQPVPTIRKFPQASYWYPSEGRQNANYNHRKLTKLITAISNSMKISVMLWRATQEGLGLVESSFFFFFWKVLTICGPRVKGMADHFRTLALRTPWAVWKDKNIRHWKMNSPGWYMTNMLMKKSWEIAPEGIKRLNHSGSKPSCGYVWRWKQSPML